MAPMRRIAGLRRRSGAQRTTGSLSVPRTEALLLCTVAALAACSQPDLQPFADATAELHASVLRAEHVTYATMQEAGTPDLADELRGDVAPRLVVVAGLADYSDALSAIAEAGRGGYGNAGQVAGALDNLLGTLAAPTLPANYVALGQSLYGYVAQVRAAR